MDSLIPSTYFSDVPQVTDSCLHLLSDILQNVLCTYLTDSSYCHMHLFGLKPSGKSGDLLSLSNGVPSEDTCS